MVTGLRGSALLAGYRGQPAVDVDSLVEVLHRVSRLVEEMPEVAELDCNPVIATPDGRPGGGRSFADRPRCRPSLWTTPAICANCETSRLGQAPPWVTTADRPRNARGSAVDVSSAGHHGLAEANATVVGRDAGMKKDTKARLLQPSCSAFGQ